MKSLFFFLTIIAFTNVFAVSNDYYDEINKQCKDAQTEVQIEVCKKIKLIQENRRSCTESEEKCDEMEVALLQILYLTMKMKGY